MVDKAVLDKVGKLARLALDNPESEESRTAGVQALALMKEHELVLVPLSEIQRYKQTLADTQALAKKVEGDAKQNMFMGALAGYMFASKGKLF